MGRRGFPKIGFLGDLQANTRRILAVCTLSIALLVGFYAGTLYASTWMRVENGVELGSLVTEADYVILVNEEGVICARNGSTGQIDYSGAGASSVINSAIEALPRTGGRIFIKEGTYTISETIMASSNVTLIGAGFGSRLVLAAGSNTALIRNSHRSHGDRNIMIANLHLHGNKRENPVAMSVISFLRVWNSTIQNCWVHDAAFAGILFEYGGGNIIQNNFVYENRNAGIEGTHEDHDVVANNVVHSNQGDPYGHGIDYCTGSRCNVFDGNVCYNNGLTSGGGLALWDGFENTIVGNTLTSNFVGLTVGVPSFGNKTDGNLITGNTVSNNTSVGLHVEGENILVSKNTFSFNGDDGVYVNGSSTRNILIEGNCLRENQGWQVHVTTFPADTIIKNNFIFGNSLVKNQGTNTSIQWNSGYNTENSGTAVIQAGRTDVSFEHELVSKPTRASVTPKDNLEGRSYWYTANSTHITIHVSFSDAGNNHFFDWSAQTH